MRFSTPNCPECNEQVRGTFDRIPGIAELAKTEDGDFHYAGGTDVWWDDQHPVCDETGTKASLICPNGHRWFSEVDDLAQMHF